jgi:hypothetical protein
MEQDCLCVKMITLWYGRGPFFAAGALCYGERANSSFKNNARLAINIHTQCTHILKIAAALFSGFMCVSAKGGFSAGFIKFNLHTRSGCFLIYNFSVMGLTQQNQLWVLLPEHSRAREHICDISPNNGAKNAVNSTACRYVLSRRGRCDFLIWNYVCACTTF